MKPKQHLSAQQISQLEVKTVQHQFNDNAIRQTKTLSDPTGMQRVGVHLVRLAPGRDSTTHHYHDADEEFVYIVSGQGIAKIGDEEVAVGPGDFMGFAAPSPAHSMRNTSDEDLVYLMGGERNSTDVVHYPEQERSMIKSDGKRLWAYWQDLHIPPPR